MQVLQEFWQMGLRADIVVVEDFLQSEAQTQGLLCLPCMMTMVEFVSDGNIISHRLRWIMVMKQWRVEYLNVICGPGARNQVRFAHWIAAGLEELLIVSSESAFMSIKAHLASSIACLAHGQERAFDFSSWHHMVLCGHRWRLPL